MQSILYFSLSIFGVADGLTWKEKGLFWFGAILVATPFTLIGTAIGGVQLFRFSIVTALLSAFLAGYIIPVFGADWFSDRTHKIIMAGIGLPLFIGAGAYIECMFLSTVSALI